MEGLKEWVAWSSVGREERKRFVDEVVYVSRGRIRLDRGKDLVFYFKCNGKL